MLLWEVKEPISLQMLHQLKVETHTDITVAEEKQESERGEEGDNGD